MGRFGNFFNEVDYSSFPQMILPMLTSCKHISVHSELQVVTNFYPLDRLIRPLLSRLSIRLRQQAAGNFNYSVAALAICSLVTNRN